MKRFLVLSLLLACCLPSLHAEEITAPSYSQHIAPILKKYCVGCHNDFDAEGKFAAETYAQLQQGSQSGPVFLAGQSESSRMIRLITGEAEPRMPPKGNEAPTKAEIALLKSWIDAGAKGPEGMEPDPRQLIVPEIQPNSSQPQPVTAAAWSPKGDHIALAKFAKVELIDARSKQIVHTLEGFAGKVNAVSFSEDGSQLVAASGVSGLYGQAIVWNVQDGSKRLEVQGHRDTLYAARLSRDGKRLATAGYDSEIIVWNSKSKQPEKTLSGHNGAIYDLAFHPSGNILASASADETCKVWDVESGKRLDTLSQPLDEQYVVRFSPDGKQVIAGGADNRIRVWKLVSINKAKINPLRYARFAHEGAITQLAFSPDGKYLVSAAEDRTLKLFSTESYTQRHAFDQQEDTVTAIAFAPQGESFLVARMDGTWQTYPLPKDLSADQGSGNQLKGHLVTDVPEKTQVEEQEPNNTQQTAQKITIPATINGRIHSEQGTDEDLFQFSARKGEQWMVEVNAARSKSPLDSKVEVLDAEGNRIQRVLLQAVRDSYFTFRGKDSDTSNDFRVHNWEEMELNEYLYANGEVVKLWLYPRGPDSGFKVYPGFGKRHTYFDTTALSHPLHEPCYIVRPRAPGSTIIPNGLPVFPIYYENDDESQRRFGNDSLLTFTAPQDGDYLVKLTDVRGFGGENYKYQLTVRPRRPSFRVSLNFSNSKIFFGSGREFTLKAQRLDDFQGPITVNIDNVPAGFVVPSPIVIQSGQYEAVGTVYATPEAKTPSKEACDKIQITAAATIAGESVQQSVKNFGHFQVEDKAPPLTLEIVSAGEPSSGHVELVIHPGETLMAKVNISRQGHNGVVSFGKEDAGRNLPHGVFVDNIGLNGLLLLQGQNQREFFITAAPWVPESTRQFHLKANVAGGITSLPVTLKVRRQDQLSKAKPETSE